MSAHPSPYQSSVHLPLPMSSLSDTPLTTGPLRTKDPTCPPEPCWVRRRWKPGAQNACSSPWGHQVALMPAVQSHNPDLELWLHPHSWLEGPSGLWVGSSVPGWPDAEVARAWCRQLPHPASGAGSPGCSTGFVGNWGGSWLLLSLALGS